MAAYEVVLLDNVNVLPNGFYQLRAANTGDTYEMPADTNITGDLTVTGSFPQTSLVLGIACSDETTDLTTGTGKAEFQIVDGAFTLTGVYATVTTAPTGSVLTVDINEGGTTILSTKLTIDASEKTSDTAATPAVISDSALAENAVITVDIDAVGASVAGAGLKVYLVGYWT